VFLLSFYARAFSSNVLTTVKLLPSRSKKLLEASIADATSSQSLSRTSKKRILLMDEVDGMAGNEDRGGMAELIHLIKASKIPIICMCNDRNHQKIRSLANHCFDLRFQRPRAEQIKAAMMSVCFKEKLKISPDALTELIVGCNQDVRQVSVDKETNLNEMVPVIITSAGFRTLGAVLTSAFVCDLVSAAVASTVRICNRTCNLHANRT
jgi:DNA polymerase III delta prime subunit